MLWVENYYIFTFDFIIFASNNIIYVIFVYIMKQINVIIYFVTIFVRLLI